MTNYEKARAILKENNQEQVLSNYEKLSDENKEKLINQILEIDFKQINNLYKETKNPQIKKKDKIEPIPYIDKTKLSKEEITKYKQIGIQAIKQGKLAVVTMAGGQRNEAWTQWSKRYIYARN